MAVSTAAPEQTIASDLWNELAGLVNGTNGEPVQLIAYSSSVNPNLKISNLNTSGTALDVYNGTLHHLTAVNNGPNSGYVTITNLRTKGGFVYDVKAYGATGDGVTDDTSAIQAAITAAKATGGIVYFPPTGSTSYLCGSLNLTDVGGGVTSWGVTLMGAGWQATRLSIASGQSATNWLDCTGSTALTIRDMQIGTTVTASASAEAECGILLAAKNGSTAANAVHLGPGLRVTGRFSKAAIYCYGMPSWDAIDADFYNYYDGAARVVWFTSTNAGSAASDFVTIATGTQGVSDVTLTACEIHELSKYNAGAASSAIPLTLDAATNVKMLGGNISGNNATQYVELVGYAGTGGLTFENVTLYREGASGTVSAQGFKITSSAGHARDLSIRGLKIQATTGILAGVSNAQYTGLVLGPWTGSGGLTYVLSFDSAGGTLTESDLWCNANQVQAATITGGVLRAPGTVTAGTSDSSLRAGNGFLALASALNVPATTGLIRLPTQAAISWRGGSSNDLQGIASTNTDRIQIGATTQVVGTILNGTTDHDFQIAGTSKAKVTTAGLKPTRLVGDSVATALATGNFASLSAGWGSTASCSAVARHELAGRFTITSNGSGLAANPTLVFTYPGGAYAVAPEVYCIFVGGTGAGTIHQVAVTPSTSTCTFQMFFTPAGGGTTYIYQIIVIG